VDQRGQIVTCVLRAIGTLFDVDAFLAASALETDPAFHRGEVQLAGLSGGAKHAASGFNACVSVAGVDDLAGQIRDAVQFLNVHESELRRLGSSPGVEEVCLDFAVRRREGAVQSEIFPAELLWLAGALDIDLIVTHYAVADQKS
jgi:hypothetical protein